MLLSLALSPLGMPLWLSLLVGNLLSSFIMTFVTMPYYVNPLLKHWLRPPPDMPPVATNWRGVGIVAAVTAFWVAVFYLVTTQL
jgi:antibiotic biosynthesis monooxygenase (ABM) superfamily enzyme